LKKKKKPTLSALEAKLDGMFSEWIRRSSADEGGTVGCVTCGKLMYWKNDGAQAGHFIKRQHRSVRWDERNVHVQCVYCNKWRNGEEGQHGDYIIRTHGIDAHQDLFRLKHQVKKYTRSDLEALITEYKTKLKELETVVG
jgi:hypothetical protein